MAAAPDDVQALALGLAHRWSSTAQRDRTFVIENPRGGHMRLLPALPAGETLRRMNGTYFCILWCDRPYFTWLLSRRKVERRKVDHFSIDLDHADSLRPTFVDAVRSHGGDQADIVRYRMDVYELVDGQPGRLVIPSYRYTPQPDNSDDSGG